MTEEAIGMNGTQVLSELLEPRVFELPTVLLTKDGSRSAVAARLLAQLPNLTILERPAPVSSILSAVQSAKSPLELATAGR